MSAPERLRQVVARADAGVFALRDQLTAGQRWTAVLTVALVVVVLALGLPTKVVVTPGPVFEGTRAGASDGVAASEPAAPYAGAASVAAGAADDEAVLPNDPDADIPFDDVVTGEYSQLPAAAPAIVALVRAGDGLPGRDDAAIARIFLDRAGFPSTAVTYDAARPTLCDEVVAAGNVVVASTGLEPALRDCIAGRGVAVVSFDATGNPASSVVSTRRRVRDSLDDLGAWGAGRALRGRVGVVAAAALRGDVEPAVAGWEQRGVDVVATTFLGDSPTEVPDAVRRFSSAGVQVVVFAVPADVQRRWVAHEAVLSPGARHVVSDAFDLLDEVYPPTFDGALAHTSLRVPWFAREHGETEQQATCRQTWEGAGARTMLSSETVRVYAWCQHAALVADALRAAQARPEPFADVLRSLTVVSPLTSDLGPLPDGGWGPTQDAELTWKADCRCWRSARPFAARPA